MIDTSWPAGWYQDPWYPEQMRYWNGLEWTPDTRPTTAVRRKTWVRWLGGIAVLVVIAVVAGLIAANNSGTSRVATPRPTPPTLSPTAPSTSEPAPQSSDPAARRLIALGLRPHDVAGQYQEGLIDGGNLVGTGGAATLDLCGQTFASESQRTARYQTAEVDPQGDLVLSTEAVLYSSPNGTAQAFTELRQVITSCPASQGAVSLANDNGWPATPGVERLALNVTLVNADGTRSQSIAVYLRRGRVLLGIYFDQPNLPAQPSIGGRTTIPSTVGLFAGRLAALPQSVLTAPGAV